MPAVAPADVFLEERAPCPVGDRAPLFQQSRSREHEGSRAHGADARRGCGLIGQPSLQDGITRRGVGARASDHHDRVAPRQSVQWHCHHLHAGRRAYEPSRFGRNQDAIACAPGCAGLVGDLEDLQRACQVQQEGTRVNDKGDPSLLEYSPSVTLGADLQQAAIQHFGGRSCSHVCSRCATRARALTWQEMRVRCHCAIVSPLR
jgi:hypothetical protein